MAKIKIVVRKKKGRNKKKQTLNDKSIKNNQRQVVNIKIGNNPKEQTPQLAPSTTIYRTPNILPPTFPQMIDNQKNDKFEKIEENINALHKQFLQHQNNIHEVLKLNKPVVYFSSPEKVSRFSNHSGSIPETRDEFLSTLHTPLNPLSNESFRAMYDTSSSSSGGNSVVSNIDNDDNSNYGSNFEMNDAYTQNSAFSGVVNPIREQELGTINEDDEDNLKEEKEEQIERPPSIRIPKTPEAMDFDPNIVDNNIPVVKAKKQYTKIDPYPKTNSNWFINLERENPDEAQKIRVWKKTDKKVSWEQYGLIPPPMRQFQLTKSKQD
jgi:hypothetical protein